MNDTTDRPTMEEAYVTASASNNLRLDKDRPGAVNMLIAAGVASRGDLKGNRPLGGALQRLLTEWEQVAKPHRMPVRSVKDLLEVLPLINTGTRQDRSGKMVPTMVRDRDGARVERQRQQQASDQLYAQELLQIAQRLPSRVLVRESLFGLALSWGCERADDLVAEAIVYWLASKCRTCRGTGAVQAGDKVRTCGDCGGTTQAPVPGGYEGRRMLDFMDLCRVTWLGAFKQTYRDIHRPA